MYRFPSLPIWESVQGAVAIYLAATVLVLGGVGIWLLRHSRQPRPEDVGVWIATGIVLSIAFISVSSNVRLYRELDVLFLFIVWEAVVFGATWSQKRLLTKLTAKHRAASVVAAMLVGVLLVWMILPSVGSGPVSERAECMHNLHTVGRALHDYHETSGSFPAQFEGQPPVSWRVELLPWIDHAPLHRGYDPSAAWNSPGNLAIARYEIESYSCPMVPHYYRSRDGLHFTSYAVVAGPGTLWQGEVPMSLDSVKDGSAHTLLVVEACGRQIVWTEPRDIDIATTEVGVNLPGAAKGESNGMISSYHPGGAVVLMADGTVRMMSAATDSAVIDALLTADGREEVGNF